MVCRSGLLAVLWAAIGQTAGWGWWAPVSPHVGANMTFSYHAAPNGTGGEGDTTRSGGHSPPANRSWWRFWNVEKVPLTPNSTSGGGTAQSGPTSSDNWFFWGFRLLAWGGSYRVFSTPGSGGSLSLNGAWLLFLVDACGVWMFGDWWPTVATGCCLIVTLLLIIIVLLILHLVSRTWCCRCLGCLCRKCCRRPPSVDLPETPVTQGFQRLVLTGPAGVRAADTEFYQQKVRGRGTNRRPNDLVVVVDAGVVRLQLDPNVALESTGTDCGYIPAGYWVPPQLVEREDQGAAPTLRWMLKQWGGFRA